MKRLALLAALTLAACGGNSTVETHGTTGGTGSTGTATGTGTGGNGAGSTTGNTWDGGGCAPNGTLVGAANAGQCCTGYADNTGKCATQPVTTGSSGTSGTTGTGTTGTATGTTTGGTCPQNMPDIANGTTTVVDGGSCSEFGCPQGFTCVNSQCILNGGNGGLQVTLSFDNDEDLDLHVIEPNGTSAVWYGDTNRPAGTSNSGAVGSLDRDSNAGCNIDHINIENVIYPASGFPSGTYKVYVDYYEQCDGNSTVPYGVQVRANGAIYTYCGTISNQDACSSPVCTGPGAKLVTTFTVP